MNGTPQSLPPGGFAPLNDAPLKPSPWGEGGAQRRMRGPSSPVPAAAGYFAPRRKRFICLRRPHFFQQRKKWGKERRQKLRFCTSPARYTALVCKAAPPRNRHFLTRCRSADCASTAFRCRCLLLWQKLFVLPCRRLRNNYILCPTGTPTFAAWRRQRRDLIIAQPQGVVSKGGGRSPLLCRFKGLGFLRKGGNSKSPFP